MRKIFKLIGLECANCAAKIEKTISELEGVDEVSVNFMTEKLIIEANEDKIDDIVIASRKIAQKMESNIEMKEIN